jgi:hypothetical protein
MRVARLLIPAVAVALLAGCAVPASRPRGVPTSAAPTPTAGTDRAAVYAAVLKRYLTHGSDNSFGDNSQWGAIYVLDYTDAGAGDPMDPAGKGEPISMAEQRLVAAALPGVTLTFIHDRDSVMVSKDKCAQVKGGGILITIGPPVPAGGDLHVGVNGFVACLAATWLTYVVSPSGDWHVTGTTGPMAIA